jgi:hypothetical protein
MDSAPDEGPQVFIQLRPQISTEKPSDAKFESKKTATAARISSRLKSCNISTLTARISVIAEDEYVSRRYHDDNTMGTLMPQMWVANAQKATWAMSEHKVASQDRFHVADARFAQVAKTGLVK